MIKHKFLTLLVALCATTALWASNTITYTATEKLPETVSEYTSGLHTNAFNVSIYYHAFSNGVGTVTFAGEVTRIGYRAFWNCSGLTSVTIPNSVTTIGEYAFYNCSGLTSVTIPNSVTTIGKSAFYNVNNITYSGTATGSPWGAKCVNGYVDGYLVYSDATKTTLCGCFTNATGAITIPNSVKTIGDYAFEDCSGLTSVTIGNSVKTIGDYAFYGCSKLASITIPNSVTTIGDHAFYYCRGLTSVTIGNSVTTIGNSAFSGCSGLTSVTIPNSVTTIGESAFAGCDGLTSVTIGNSVKTIGDDAFGWCDSLTSVTLNSDAICSKTYYDGLHMVSIGSIFGSQVKEYIIGNSVTKIGDYAFYDCDGLTSVTIPNSVTTIGAYAFRNCTGLTSITIPNSVTTIGDYAFYGCSGWTSVTIPNSVTTIGDWAFYKCSGLTSITIPNSVTTIGKSAFSGCSGLTSVTLNSNAICSKTYYYGGYNIGSIFGSQVKEYIIGNSVTTIGNSAFRDCSGLTSITIGNSVTTIVGDAFEGCDGLTKTNYTGTIADWCKIKFWGDNPIYYSHNFFINDVEIKDLVIPEGVDTIGDKAFYDCKGLTSVTIPNSVTEIGSCAFYGCSKLTSVTLNSDAICSETYTPNYGNIGGIFGSQVKEYIIGNSVTTIGEYAFYWCSGLTSVTIPNSVTTIGEHAFEYCSGLTSVTIPNSVTTIGERAFRGCSGLTSVTIPNSVTTIGVRAFGDCSGLTSVTFLGKDCQNNIGDEAFYDVGKNAPATLFLPADWTGSKPVDSKTKWYGGYFTYTDTPTAIESIDDTQCTMHKFLRNGQVIIRQGNKTYNVIGQEVK